MNRFRLTPLALLAAVMLTACVADDQVAESQEPATPDVVTTPMETETVSLIPKPDETQAVDLLAALSAIDPDLDRDVSITRARDMCTSILAEARGEGGTFTLEELVLRRFTGVDPALDDGQVAAIIDLIRSSEWCHD